MVDKVIKLEGFSEFEAQLHALADGYRYDLVARNTLAKAGRVAMDPVLQSVQALAPYDDLHNTSGIHLRDTRRIDSRIPYDSDKKSPSVSMTDATITIVSVKRSAVSLSQEYGNARTAAQPYLRVSLERNVDTVLSILKSQLGQIIPDYWKSLRRRGIK
jgi:hypothetical protein